MGALGKQVSYPTQYTPAVLEFIPRSKSRAPLFGNQVLPFDGIDIWNAYEFSWLGSDGYPEIATIRIEYGADSTHIVESKSLKLYLGSFSFSRFSSKQEIVDILKKDLSQGLGAQSIYISIHEPEADMLSVAGVKGYCVDIHRVKNPTFEYTPSLLRIGSEMRDEILYTNAFRSLCPVTSQPDWATVIVLYRGAEIIPESFSAYITSLRTHQGFHESCCELIFNDIKTKCAPEELSVLCAFTRRGGIDINPIRTTKGAKGLQYRRLKRQ